MILDYLKKKLFLLFPSKLPPEVARVRRRRALWVVCKTQSTMGSMYDESAAIFAKDIGLGQIFLLDRVADLARTI